MVIIITTNFEHFFYANHCSKYFLFNLILEEDEEKKKTYEADSTYYPYLTNKDTEAQRGQTPTQSHSKRWGSFEPTKLNSRVCLHGEGNQLMLPFLISVQEAFPVDYIQCSIAWGI